MSFHPDKKSKEYRDLVVITNEEIANIVWNLNKGNPIHKNRKGEDSELFYDLKNIFGEKEAVKVKSLIYSNEFLQENNWITLGTEPSLAEIQEFLLKHNNLKTRENETDRKTFRHDGRTIPTLEHGGRQRDSLRNLTRSLLSKGNQRRHRHIQREIGGQNQRRNDLRRRGKAVVSQRFSPQESTGISRGGKILEDATSIVERRENSTDVGIEERYSFKREDQRRAAQESALEDYARQNNCWYKNTDKELYEQYGEPYAEGGEAIIYDNGQTVIKSIGLDYYVSPQLALDRIILHNYLFGEYTHLTVKGFGRNKEGDFQIIVEQPFVRGTKLTEREIREYAENLGFKLKNARNWTYTTPDIYLSDLHDENVIRTENGNIAVIDADIRINVSELNQGGRRTYHDF